LFDLILECAALEHLGLRTIDVFLLLLSLLRSLVFALVQLLGLVVIGRECPV